MHARMIERAVEINKVPCRTIVKISENRIGEVGLIGFPVDPVSASSIRGNGSAVSAFSERGL